MTLAKKIQAMNVMYRLPAYDSVTADQLTKFKRTLSDEVREIDDIVRECAGQASNVELRVMLADLLGDVVVYCHSEALKYGIPLDDVLNIIMASNESKLDTDGEPIYNADGKFLKGTGYWQPEPQI